MRHKQDYIERDASSVVCARRAKRNRILKNAKDACKRLGGYVEMGEGFVVVDTSKYNVSPK